MKFTLICFVSLFYFQMCNSNVDNEQSAIPESKIGNELSYDEDLEQRNTSDFSDNATPSKQSKIIKDGYVRIQSDNIHKSKQVIDTILNSYNAYFENESYNASQYNSTYNLKIRVASKDFESLLKAIEKGENEITSKTISTRDVTEEFIDITSRLETNRSYLDQYRALLKQATSIKDILEIQEKIRILESEIDSGLGRLKYLEDQVSFSTLNLELYQEYEVRNDRVKRNFGEKIITGVINGFDSFLSFIIILINFWPFILISILVFSFRSKIATLIKSKK